MNRRKARRFAVAWCRWSRRSISPLMKASKRDQSVCVLVPDRKDEDEREAFDDDDMKLIRANLHRLDANDRLLLRVLATTGMRRGEAFEIASEKTEDGIRYCMVGTKTPQSLRRIPFPKDLLPHLPKKITGPLITGRKDSASKRLREFLDEIGHQGSATKRRCTHFVIALRNACGALLPMRPCAKPSAVGRTARKRRPEIRQQAW